MQFIDFFYPHIALIALGSGMFTLVLHRVWRPDATLIAFSIFSFAISASFALMTWVLWQGGNVPIVVYAVQHILFAIGFVTFYEANRLQLDGVRGRAEVFCLYLVSAFLIVLLVVSIIAPERIVVTIVHDSLGQYT